MFRKHDAGWGAGTYAFRPPQRSSGQIALLAKVTHAPANSALRLYLQQNICQWQNTSLLKFCLRQTNSFLTKRLQFQLTKLTCNKQNQVWVVGRFSVCFCFFETGSKADSSAECGELSKESFKREWGADLLRSAAAQAGSLHTPLLICGNALGRKVLLSYSRAAALVCPLLGLYRAHSNSDKLGFGPSSCSVKFT